MTSQGKDDYRRFRATDILRKFRSQIVYCGEIAHMVGGVAPAVFLSMMLRWDGHGAREDGFIWKTREEIYRETGLTRCEQESARKELRSRGILEESKIGLPARNHYRLNLNALDNLFCKTMAPEKDKEWEDALSPYYTDSEGNMVKPIMSRRLS